MTTSADSTEDDRPDTSPFVPGSQGRATGASEPVPSLPTLPGVPPAASNPEGVTRATGAELAEAPATPFIPAAVPVVAAPAEPVKFDAKEMVESQKRYNAKPAYGALPTPTEANRDAAKKLKAKAQRKRVRNKRVGWFVGVLFLGLVGAAGWFAYQAYQDEQDQRAVELAEAQNDGEPGQIDAASPLGQQVEVIGALDDVNSGASASAGGLLGAVDDAREAVGETNGDAGGAPAGPIGLVDVLPPVVLEIGERLPDATGRETYIVNADDFAGADPAAFGRFVRLLATQPQSPPGAPAVEGLPGVGAEQIVISVEREGDQLQRAIVVGIEVGINVDYRP